MLTRDNTALVVIDVQEKITEVMHDKNRLLSSLQRLIRGANVLEIPVILTEQYPQGLGATVPEVREVLESYEPIEKMAFSCCNVDSFMTAVEKTGRKNILVSGIEAHVCVYQTVMQFLQSDFHIEVVADAVSSRAEHNIETALIKMRDYGADVTTVEMALFELLEVAGSDRFKQVSRIVK